MHLEISLTSVTYELVSNFCWIGIVLLHLVPLFQTKKIGTNCIIRYIIVYICAYN